MVYQLSHSLTTFHKSQDKLKIPTSSTGQSHQATKRPDNLTKEMSQTSSLTTQIPAMVKDPSITTTMPIGIQKFQMTNNGQL